MKKNKVKPMIYAVIIIAVLILVDQVTKWMTVAYLKPKGSIPVIKNFFTLTYVENDGGAWGMFGGKMWMFYIVTLFAIGLFAYMMKDFNLQTNKIYSIALALIMSGTIGNFIDRIFRKFVVDFIEIDLFSYKSFPVFNVADICLTIGVGLLLFDLLFGKSAELLK